ncbi:Glycine N-acyltransferase-like protein Keg1 [Heterocephalus glaber]|nr:Glycine N-acyltransferase-like protein Keg1 [Heterocephalus glaber]
MNQGNPFKLKAVVDSWPDFNTIIVHPQEQEMTDDLDHYTNTYLIYSKDPEQSQEFLGSPAIINWKQHLQIQSSQSSLNRVIQNLVDINLSKVTHTQCNLYMMFDTAKRLVPSLVDIKNLPPNGDKPKSLNQEMFKFSSLDVTHTALVNQFWHFGGTERSQRFIERCIRTFPSICLLGPEGTPVTWSLMDHTGELRMGATVPEYRGQGLMYHMAFYQLQALEKLGLPLYAHTDKANHIMQRVMAKLRHVPMPCDWNQWNCVPL